MEQEFADQLAVRADHPSCPICGYQGKFKPHRRTGRANASCGGCGSRERHRLVALYLRGPGSERCGAAKVLHFSPEYFLAPFFSRAALYVTADLTDPNTDIHTDITNMGIGNNTFDVVMCNHVLEHIEDDSAAIREIYRVLAPGGVALIIVPLDQTRDQTYEDRSITSPEGRTYHFGQFDHLRRYGKDFRHRLAKPGFKVTEFHATPEQQVLHAIHNATIIFLAGK